ncbi:His-Xaa-Ser system radical SAM maturase HxsC [Alcaligenaceae bacterium B3P038]|nr:His-Xaa-Ser system radical SAM maturase HxsC [Alcaligenaceae bacterium B3P038]
MRKARISLDTRALSGVALVVSLDRLATTWHPDRHYLILVSDDAAKTTIDRLRIAGADNIGWVCSDELIDGDVVSPLASRDVAVVLFRPSDMHHSLLLTNRCNSYCLMCSQPPTTNADDWLVQEAIDVIRHIEASPSVLGLSGGEPLLLGRALRVVIDAVAQYHPNTRIEVLTNARLFSNAELAEQLLDEISSNVTWLIPLYGHADYLHDFVVQAPGAFDQTIAGLLNLREWEQAVQLRIVLIEPVLKVLPELAAFIGRNVPFVREVAMMACEPIGFALANSAHCSVDLVEWELVLGSAATSLRRHRVPFLFMNLPLCALPPSLRSYAHRSISDWKNVFAAECSSCVVKDDCSGLFAWHERGWKPTNIKALQEIFS